MTDSRENRFANLPGKPYEGPEPYIFVSYKHEEWPVVFPIVKRLINDGYRVWYDEGIEAGSEWRCSIQEHVENCSVMLPFLSDKYCDSKFCRRELSVASDDDKILIPILLEDTQLGNGVRLLVADTQGIVKHEIPDEDLFYQRLLSFNSLEITKGDPPSLEEKVKNRNALLSASKLYDSGMNYYYGKGVQRDYPKALQLLSEAAEVGLNAQQTSALEEVLPRLNYWVGRSYADSADGSPKLLAKAVSYFEKAGELGDPYGLCELGRYYREGRGVAKDVEKAMTLSKKAAELGDYGGNYDIGTCYDKGIGVESNALLAADYFKSASVCEPSSSHAKALALLRASECYSKGGNHAEAKRCVDSIEVLLKDTDDTRETSVLEKARLLSFDSIEVRAADFTRDFLSDKVPRMTMYRTTNDDVVYDMDLTKVVAKPGQIAYLSSKGDNGLRFILQNGYPHKTFRNNKGMDAYITQMAIWWYLSESLPMDFRYASEDEDKYGLVEIARKLVNDARKASLLESHDCSNAAVVKVYSFLDLSDARIVGLFDE